MKPDIEILEAVESIHWEKVRLAEQALSDARIPWAKANEALRKARLRAEIEADMAKEKGKE